MTIKVLIVDDEESITTLIEHHLNQEGYMTTIVHDGESAIQSLDHNSFDLVVLDLMLPKLSGIKVCEKMRSNQNDTPVIMLTAKGEEEDKIKGLNVGADDYLTKPFSPKELVARIQAVLRRFNRGETESRKVINIQDVEIHEDYYEVYKQGKHVSFTRKEFELLLYLAKQIGKPVKREVLLRDIWDFDYIGDTRIVDVHISHLREKLEDDPKKPTLIKTVRGVGYKIEG
ncbi:two-component system alkaline phosphatase synthesis response regulator PhoP [Alkalibacillus filiformis]|uniref:Two-component system alkaline phosphatase synthesis response regulator PhoP n=1 Tax=Alkalibacillus filiformis TaxID=200990 RepID=A0ABU0DS01_9BACI|nr:response regulator transcription factor [Alkalibacillus filiformis]MDQ0351228.1 two-component system alkaline phosphatase synthesis response regulator PhoP [Alkalibacillus filiformis]